MPEMAAVLRCSGGLSLGGTHRKGGRGAKSASRFGGSLSVMVVGAWLLSLIRNCALSKVIRDRIYQIA